jgi:succinyl-CoA synthetase beta subunit
VKFIGTGFEHKTDLGAVRVGLENRAAVSHALVEMVSSIGKTAPSLVVDQVLVEEMIHAPVAELLVGVQSDPQFGQALTLASGGTLVELVRDSQTLLLPSSRTDIEWALMSLRCSALLQGYRGQGAVDIAALIDVLYAVTVFSEPYRSRGLELDINPLFVLKDGPVAADVLLRLIPE